MAYTTVNKSLDFFNTVLYTSTGNDNLAITGVGFEPSLTWIKKRAIVSGSNTNEWHMWADQVRGSGYYIASNSNASQTSTTNDLKSWQSDGFTLGTDNKVNQGSSPHTYAAWNWKANGQGSSNTDGSINTTYTSVNTTAGFSICKWTGTGNAATIGHGLGAVPKMIIVKNLSSSTDWYCYNVNNGNTHSILLNSDSAKVGAYADNWNNTTPTSSVFSVGDSSSTGGASGNNMIAYCFAEKTGYSKFGSYTGNGNADGTFVYTGMRPSFVIFKRTDSTSNWRLFDNKRLGYNSSNSQLYPNLQNPEDTGTNLDMCSNGFKILTTSGDMNSSGGTYIYMAFGQSLVGSNNVPCTAR